MDQLIRRLEVPILCALLVTMLVGRPTLADNRLRFEATLVGSAGFPQASGDAKFEQDTYNNQTQSEFQLQVQNVNLPDGTTLQVTVNGVAIPGGTMTLQYQKAQLNLQSDNGQAVPAIKAGDSVAVITLDKTVVVSGTFANRNW